MQEENQDTAQTEPTSDDTQTTTDSVAAQQAADDTMLVHNLTLVAFSVLALSHLSSLFG